MPTSPQPARKAERILRVWPRAELCDRARLEGGEALSWTWEELAGKLADTTGWDGVRARVAVTAAIGRTRAGPRLGRVLETRGILGALAEVAADLAVAGVGAAEALDAAGAIGGARGAQLCELLALLAEAERLSGQPAQPALFRRAASRARDAPALAGVARVEIVGEARWDPARVALVCALAERVPVRVRVPCDPGRPRLMAAVEGAFAAFETLGERAPGLDVHAADPADEAGVGVERVLGRVYPGGTFPSPLARHSRASLPASAEGDPAGAVEVVAAPGARAAAREAARLARRAIDAGVAPEDIVIAAGSGAAHAAAAAALARAGVPVDLPPARASRAPVVALALGLHELAEDGLHAEPLLELVGSRYVRGEPELHSLEIAALAREAGVRRCGRDGDAAARLAALAERALPERAARVRRAAAHLGAIAAVIEALPARATLAEHVAALARACQRLGLGEGALRGPPRSAEPALAELLVAEERALAHDQQAWAAFAQALADVARLGAELAPEVVVGRRALTTLLRDLVDRRPAGRTGARGGRVVMGRLERVLGRPARVVIVLGVEDGRLPARAHPHPLYGHGERAALDAALGAGRRFLLRGGEAWLDGERRAADTLTFYRVLAAASDRAHVIYALADEGDAESTRSSFIDDLLRAGATRREVARRLVPGLADLMSPADLLARLALDLMAEPGGVLRRDARLAPGPAAALYRATQAALGARLTPLCQIATIERGRLAFFEGRRAAGPWEGLVGPLPVIGERLGGDAARPLSVSALEKHARCPFRLLAERVLGVDDDDAPGEDLDSRRRGTLAHACLEGTYRRMIERGVPWPQALPDGPLAAELAALVDEACTQAARELEGAGFVGHPALWQLRRLRARADVERILRRDAEEPFGGQPRFLEVVFGPGGTWPALCLREGAESVFFRGKIDRVDVGERGMVIDYKAGSLSSQNNHLRPSERQFTEFQLALYAAAARAALPDGPATWDARYVSVRDARATRPLSEVCEAFEHELAVDEAARAAARAAGVERNLGDRIWRHVRALRAGDFSVAPQNCDLCPSERACRVVRLEKPEDET